MGAVQKQQIWKSMGGVSGDKMASSSMCEFTMLTLGPDFSAITYFIQPGRTWERLMEMTQRATPVSCHVCTAEISECAFFIDHRPYVTESQRLGTSVTGETYPPYMN